MWALPTRCLSSKLPGTSSPLRGGQFLPLPGETQLEQLLSVLCFSPLSIQGRSGKPWGWGLEGRAALEAGQQVKDMLALGPHSESQQEHPPGLPRCSEVFGGMYLRGSDAVVYRGNALISLHDNLHM